MYAKYAHLCCKPHNVAGELKLKLYHHVKIDHEFKSDCKVWEQFLDNPQLHLVVNRPMIDLNMFQTSKQIAFFTDASAAISLGFGCMYDSKWMYRQWENDFIQNYKPSIEFLELYALVVGLLTWETYFTNCKIVIHCDNMAVVNMVNNLSS